MQVRVAGDTTGGGVDPAVLLYISREHIGMLQYDKTTAHAVATHRAGML